MKLQQCPYPTGTLQTLELNSFSSSLQNTCSPSTSRQYLLYVKVITCSALKSRGALHKGAVLHGMHASKSNISRQFRLTNSIIVSRQNIPYFSCRTRSVPSEGHHYTRGDPRTAVVVEAPKSQTVTNFVRWTSSGPALPAKWCMQAVSL